MRSFYMYFDVIWYLKSNKNTLDTSNSPEPLVIDLRAVPIVSQTYRPI